MVDASGWNGSNMQKPMAVRFRKYHGLSGRKQNRDKEIEELPDEITDRMSIEQIVNYIRKQAGKHYGTPQRALSQWVDYLFMRKAQNKNLNDELFYKPKDLKQRHDELITDKKKLDTVRRMSEIQNYGSRKPG